MTAIGSIASLAADQVRATAAAARIPLLAQHAPRPPTASERQIEAGQRVLEAARAEAEAASQKVQADRSAVRGHGIVV